jgi:hypothetical protein
MSNCKESPKNSIGERSTLPPDWLNLCDNPTGFYPGPTRYQCAEQSRVNAMSKIYDYVLAHAARGPNPTVPFGEVDALWTPEKVGTAKRLIRAYKTTLAQESSALKEITDHDLWSGIVRENFGQLLQFVQNDSVVAFEKGNVFRKGTHQTGRQLTQ